MSNRDSNWRRVRESAESEEALEIRPEELQEFLSADLTGVSADPEFKERLREKLWKMVRERNRVRRDHPN